MVRISAGEFVLGSSPTEVLLAQASCASEPLGHRCSEKTFSNELGRRRVRLASFHIGRTEVTVRDYDRCAKTGLCAPAAFFAGGSRLRKPDYPVSFVSFYDAEDYCRFRGARLPSEAEFERAARGRSGRTFPWGWLFNAQVANHGRYALTPNDPTDGYAELAPVGSFPDGATAEGVHDLAGNVAEWVSDVYRERRDHPRASSGDRSRRVVRGGSFAHGEAWLRGAAREGVAPETRSARIGFRCARSETSGGASK